jgi:hypothetical protein
MARLTVRDARQVILRGAAVIVILLGMAAPGLARQTPPTQQTPPTPPAGSPPPQTPPATPPASGTTPAAPTAPAPPKPGDPAAEPASASKDRIFGVIPNYTTVEPTETVAPITSRESFKMAALDSFDPMVYPLFGVVAGVSQATNEPGVWGGGWEAYAKRYGLAFADNTVCSLVTTGLMPSLLQQDPRYYQGRKTGFFNRLYYAASRSVVTRSRTTGHPQFNVSEVGGTLVVANISNLYYPVDERTIPSTLVRWGTQAMWDTVANELKEFWPDIRRKLHGL